MASRKNNPPKILVSACLAGINCTHKAKNNLAASIRQMVMNGRAIPVCPEVLGGLGLPRENSEISGGGGRDVLAGRARVLTLSGRDVTDNFLKGSFAALNIAKKHNIIKAILKSKSPSCGIGYIYDGTFTKTIRRGDGVFASLIAANGIKAYVKDDRKA